MHVFLWLRGRNSQQEAEGGMKAKYKVQYTKFIKTFQESLSYRTYTMQVLLLLSNYVRWSSKWIVQNKKER